MKYTCTVDINLPITKTAALWDDPSHYKAWQDGFESITYLSGTPNTKGGTAKIIFQGKRRIELLETIISSDLPNEKIARYEHVHMTNTQTTRFKALGQNKTRYTSEVEYTKFNGIMIKLIAKLFPGKFKQQSQKWMHQFKAFVETTDL